MKIIGLSPAGDANEGIYRVAQEYFRSIIEAGAMPVMLSPAADEKTIEQMLNMCDGILLTGGPDVDPVFYNEEKTEHCGEISEERDRFELKLARMAVDSNKPVLAICRGEQVLNVAFGGSLWQDIPSQVESSVTHRAEDKIKPEHSVKITDSEFLKTIGFEKSEFVVNSFHHQSVKRLANGFEVMAVCKEDSIVEGIYRPDKKFVVGVQWHPELMTPHDENARKIFKAFIESL